MKSKAKFVISDLHLGAGFAPQNPLEDFVSDDDFAAFLAQVAAESDHREMDVELIIAGDMVEFLQVPAVHRFDPQVAYPPELYYPTSEVASLQKMLLVIEGHLTFFAALRNFLHPHTPRRTITILKGNHDINLYWEAVQGAIRQAVGATGERQELLTFESGSLCREGIYVEHGNQYTESVNRFDHFESPLDPQRPGELQIPPGSRFVLDFFNDVERESWWVDAVKPITALIWYGFAVDFAFAARMLLNFLSVAPVLVIGSFAAGGDVGVAAQVEALRRQLEDEQQVATLGERYATDPAFRREFDAHVGRVLQAVEVPVTSVVSAEAKEALAQAQDISETTNVALRRVARQKIAETGAQVIIFGHTHHALCERLNDGFHINAGTWVWWRDFSGMDLEEWRAFYAHPERYTQPHYLTYVRIDYDTDGNPHPQVLDFTGQMTIPCVRPDAETGKAWDWLIRLWEKLKRLWS